MCMCNAECWISPTQTLTISNESKSGILNCTATCHALVAAYFSDVYGRDIYDDPSIRQIISNYNFNSDHNCTISINITWTMDVQIRNALAAVYCRAIYYHNFNVCTTESVNITFTDVGKFWLLIMVATGDVIVWLE